MLRRPRTDRRWALVLAAGDGRRLEALARTAAGRPVPTQFGSCLSERSLLGDALARAFRLAPPERVVVVVAEQHRAWWSSDPDVARLPVENIVVQPLNRGTAAGVMLGCLRIARETLDATVAVLASDHFVREEDGLAHAFERALDEAESGRRPLVLLGITPDEPDTGYGWILPAGGPPRAPQPVAYFVEKPPRAAAEQLMRRGALWSSFLFATGLDRLLELYDDTVPELRRLLFFALTSAGEFSREGWLREIYPSLPVKDLSRDVLERCMDRLAVLAVPDVGWSDLGTPERLSHCLGDRTARGAQPAHVLARAPVALDRAVALSA